jgi:hypothetical protein
MDCSNQEPSLGIGRARWRRIARALLLSVLLLGVSGCGSMRIAPLYDWVVPVNWPEPEYEDFYPRYAELCAVSQFRPKSGTLGGSPGHGVLYLKDACLDPDSEYPRLVRCTKPSTSEFDLHHGTGISVNRWVKNANWVGVPGKLLFYNGYVAPWEKLTQERADAAASYALSLGIFDGLKIGEYPTDRPEERSLEDFVRTQSLGTDFGLRFGRTLFCARVPLEEGQLDAMMAFLNEQNRLYAEGEADYNWSGYSDNCVHLVHNAFAAALIWKKKSVHAIKIRQIFNMAIPANEFIDLATRTILYPIEDFGKLQRDGVQMESLEKFDSIATHHGAVVLTAPVHQDNDLYDPKIRMMIVQGPFRGRATRKASLLLGDSRATELISNMRSFKARYEHILADKKTEEDEFFPNLPGYNDDRRRYYAYIERELVEVEKHLEVLRASERVYFMGRYPANVSLPRIPE